MTLVKASYRYIDTDIDRLHFIQSKQNYNLYYISIIFKCKSEIRLYKELDSWYKRMQNLNELIKRIRFNNAKIEQIKDRIISRIIVFYTTRIKEELLNFECIITI